MLLGHGHLDGETDPDIYTGVHIYDVSDID